MLITLMIRGVPNFLALLNCASLALRAGPHVLVQIAEFPWGQYDVVRAFSNPRIPCSWYITLLLNSVSWSKWRVSGIPKVLNRRSMIACTTVSADVFGIASNRVNRLRWSIIESTCLHGTSVRDTDLDLYPIKSTDIRWNGRSTGTWHVGSFGRFPAVFSAPAGLAFHASDQYISANVGPPVFLMYFVVGCLER